MLNKKMPKINATSLKLNKETVRILSRDMLKAVAGGALNPTVSNCLHNMCDDTSISNCA